MGTEKNALDPTLAMEAKKAAATAKHEVLSRSSMDALLHVKPEDLIGTNPEAEVLRGNASRSACWQHGPARFELCAAADRRLTRVAAWDGMHVKKVPKVTAKLVRDTHLVVLKPAPEEDLTAIPVRRYRSSAAWINLIKLLADAGLRVATGWRERFDVAYVPRESPLWPALVIDLGDIKDRRQEPARKKKGKSTESETQAELVTSL